MFPTLKTSYKGGLVLNENPLIVLFKNFLTAEQCHRIINLAQAKLQPAKVSKDEGDDFSKGRTGSNAWLKYSESDELLQIGETISQLVNLPLSHAESLQIVHYGPGQKYDAHFDSYDLSSTKGKRCCEKGGQRLLTCLIYLNNVPKGGATGFPKLNLEVKAEQGSMVIFHNVEHDNYSQPHKESLHGGLEVFEGEKWACNMWFHQSPVNYQFNFEEYFKLIQAGITPLQQTKASQRIQTISNHKKELFQLATQSLNNELFKHTLANQGILYWHNTSEESPPPFTNQPKRIFKLINPAPLQVLSDQIQLPKLLAHYGLLHLYPETFFSKNHALASQHSVFFVKNRLNTSENKTRCISRNELQQLTLNDNEVIQGIISNILTFENKKVTIRGYVLLAASGMAAYPTGVAMVHSKKYDPLSAEQEVQMPVRQHHEENANNSGKLLSTHQLSLADEYTTALNNLVVYLSPVLLPICSLMQSNEFALLEVDLIPTIKGNYVFIQMNSAPHFNFSENIHQLVIVPMLQWAIRGLVKLPIATP